MIDSLRTDFLMLKSVRGKEGSGRVWIGFGGKNSFNNCIFIRHGVSQSCADWLIINERLRFVALKIFAAAREHVQFKHVFGG